MDIRDIRDKYLGRTIEPDDFDTEELYEDCSDGCFRWAVSEEIELDRDELREEYWEDFREEYLRNSFYDEEEDEEEPDWDSFEIQNEFTDWLSEQTGWSRDDIERGWITAYIMFSAPYETDENDILTAIGPLHKKRLLGDDAVRVNTEPLEVTEEDCREFDRKLAEIVCEPD